MMLFSQNTIIEYGITGGGNYYQCKKTKKGTLYRSTPRVSQFLEWMTNTEVIFCQEVKHQLKNKNGNNNK